MDGEETSGIVWHDLVLVLIPAIGTNVAMRVVIIDIGGSMRTTKGRDFKPLDFE
jgi:hypothetical protein